MKSLTRMANFARIRASTESVVHRIVAASFEGAHKDKR